MTPRFLPVGPRTLLVELPDLDHTLALFDALQAAALPQVAEIVPAARTLLVRSATGVAADGRLAAAIAALPAAPAPRQGGHGETVEIPMAYDGADLAFVAHHLGLGVPDTIAAHGAAVWQVAFTGFAPGFAYMTCDDGRFDLPRRDGPRPAVPAGAVALAGRFCGIYPKASPGGWQLIGTTPLPMWDMTRTPPAALRPGMRVRFAPRRGNVHPVAAVPAGPPPATGLRVLATTFPILVQDAGRAGQAAQGIAASGALDLPALRRANRRAGNPADAAALEITGGPVRLTADTPVTLVLDGAADRARIIANDSPVPVDPALPFALDPGEVLVIAPPARGMRVYLAARGGFAAARTLGSAAADTLAGIGPAPLVAGAVIGLAHDPAEAVDPCFAPRADLPAPGETVTLPVTLGPRADWFPPAALDRLLAQAWEVTIQSSRTGLRLSGQPLLRNDTRELPSEGIERGAIQVPHSGQPVLFLADHPLTGGYPVIATLRPEALPLAGQLPPGARVRFTAAEPFAPIRPAP